MKDAGHWIHDPDQTDEHPGGCRTGFCGRMVGRPSNRDARYAQVMEALVRCVARYGLDGASLSQVAVQAGLTRPLIRHHLGNREDMIAALQGYVLQQFSDQSDALIAALPADRPSGALIDILFSDTAATPPELVLAFAALTARAAEDIDLRDACRASLLSFEAVVAATLRRDHARADDRQVEAVAHAITALYFNTTSLAPLAMPDDWTARARDAAGNLLKTLDT